MLNVQRKGFSRKLCKHNNYMTSMATPYYKNACAKGHEINTLNRLNLVNHYFMFNLSDRC